MEIRATKREVEAYIRWSKSEDRTLHSVYGRPSFEKEKAETGILFEIMPEYDGYDYRIIGHNTSTFSVGFIGTINGVKYFFYYTAHKATATPLEYIYSKI